MSLIIYFNLLLKCVLDISCLDGIKREINHLKLEIVDKNEKIAKLSMRLENEALPCQKKAEMAEKRVFVTNSYF